MPFEQIKNEQLEVVQKESSEPVYTYVRQFPQNIQGTTATVSTGSGPEIIFNIPIGSNNLSRSYMDWDSLLPSGGTGTGTNAIFWYIHNSQIPIERARLDSSQGVVLADINDLYAFSKSARYACTKFEDYASCDPVASATTVATSFGVSNYCQPSHFPLATALAGGQACSQYILNSGNSSGTSYTISAGSPGELACQQLITGTSNGAMGWKSRVYLRELMPHSICSLDKSIYFGEIIRLQINFLPRNRWGSQSSSATAAQTTAAALSQDISLSRLQLNVAVDVNPDSMNASRAAWDKGFSFICPYVKSSKRTTDTGTDFTYQDNYLSSQGESLLRVYTVFTNSLVDRTQCNLDNVNGAKIQTIQSFLNSKSINNKVVGLTEALFNDNYVYEMLKGSAFASRRAYDIQFFWVDNFSSVKKSRDWLDSDDVLSGQPLGEQGTLYAVTVGKTAEADTVFQYAVLQKEMKVSKNAGISF